MIRKESDNFSPDDFPGLDESRVGRIRNWSEMCGLLKDINPHNRRFYTMYFSVQMRIAIGKKEKAKKTMNLLDKNGRFCRFEEENSENLALIEIATRGTSNRSKVSGL